MSFWTAIVVIVGIVMIVQVIRSRRDRMAAVESEKARTIDNARERELEAEIAELKERIKVLERIACDERKQLGLADEIESLRD